MGNVCTSVSQEGVIYECNHKNQNKQMKISLSITKQINKKNINKICPICQQIINEKQFTIQNIQNIQSQKYLMSLTTQNQSQFVKKNYKNRISKDISKNLNDFQVIRGLGKGGFGKVYLIKQRYSETPFLKSQSILNLQTQQQFEDIQQMIFKQKTIKIDSQSQSQKQEKQSKQLRTSTISSQIQASKKSSSDQQTLKSKLAQNKKLYTSSKIKDQENSNDKKKELKQKYYALKIINKNQLQTSQQKQHAMAQRLILQRMNSQFIVKLHYAFQTKSRLFLIVDLLPGGQLFYLLRKMRKFDQQTAKFYAAQILLAIQYLHQKSIIYRDLKPQNILLDQDGHIKITDFGLSKILYSNNQKTYSLCGTPQYIAPQVILGKGYNQAADWFSYGSLIYDMLTGRPPFLSNNKSAMLKNITTKAVPLPYYLSDSAKSLLNGLFKIKPNQRLGFKEGASEIKKHPFFKNIDFDALKLKQIKAPITFSQNLLQNQQVYINNAGFQNWNSWCINQQSPYKFTHSKQYFQGFTYANVEQQIQQNDQEQLNEQLIGLESLSPVNSQ